MVDSYGEIWNRHDGFSISTNKHYLDVDAIYEFLSKESYWNTGIPRELVKIMIENSAICYGIYDGSPSSGGAVQVGFARVVSDMVRFAWLADVFVLPDYRGRGLSKWLMSVILDNPFLKGVRFMLRTEDAHGLYAQYGFKTVEKPENTMDRPYNAQEIFKSYGITETY